jgi:hypothetical protein
MPTLIDESGDTGPPDRGGSRHFRLAAVWMPSFEDVVRFREAVQRVRIYLNLPNRFEFKYAKALQNPELRQAFFDSALSFEFRFAIASVDKRDPYWARADRHEQHWACATEIAATLRETYQIAETKQDFDLKELVIVDDNRDRDFLNTIKRQFGGLRSSRSPGSSMIKRVRFGDSQDDEMLQLVDMVCGAVDGRDRSSYDQIAGRNLGSLAVL